MKSLHLVYSFPPNPPGGTEIYVEALCRALTARGDEAVVVAPGEETEAYALDGLRVRRFQIDGNALTLEALYGRGDARAAAAIEAITRDERPDIVHQHALTAACSVDAASRIKQAGYPLVFTYHTPTVSCQRGSLLEMGREPCDGRLDAARCTACTLQGLGVGELPSQLLGRLPAAVGQAVGAARLSGQAWTALRMRPLLDRRIEAFGELMRLVDRFVVLSPWVGEVLRANGVSERKLVSSPHGVGAARVPGPHMERPGSVLRVAHLGRLDRAKGTRLLADAVRALPRAAINLDIFGIVQNRSDADTHRALAALADGDPRIRILPPVAHGDIVQTLSTYDVVAVPSQWMETGPLVVLESFLAGVPVIGSDLGGIADKVRDGIDGLLVRPPGSIEAWQAALGRCLSEESLLMRLRRGVAPVRAMAEVARDMRALYEAVCAESRPAALVAQPNVPLDAPSGRYH